MKITMKTCTFAVLLALGQAPNSALAGNEAVGGFIGGLIGSMAGQAISQQRQQPQVQPQPVQQYQASEPQVQRRTAAPAVVRSSPLQVAYESESAPNRLQIQKYLRDKGFYASTLDGKWGPKVGSALSAYAASERQPELTESSSGSLRLMAMILDAHQGGDQTSQPIRVTSQPVQASAVAVTAAAKQGPADYDDLQRQYEEMERQAFLLRKVLEVAQSSQKGQSGQDVTYLSAKVDIVNQKLAELDGSMTKISKEATSKYQTPIKPQNANLGMSALKASQVFPKIPYYIPGTEETGEMWLAPRVDDAGRLYYELSFIDSGAVYESAREKVTLTPEELVMVEGALKKTHEWTKVAQENNVRRRLERSAKCFPEKMCEAKVPGNSSTEVLFLIYEDGSTAARLQRNKGTFSNGYNYSTESALLLSAYMDYMKTQGQMEFKAGSMTDKDFDTMFK